MKLMVVTVRPEVLAPIQAALNELDIYQMTVSEVLCAGQEEGYTLIYRSSQVRVRLLPKVRLEIAVADASVDAVMDAVVGAGSASGQVGDGKILVMELDEWICLRTKERGGVVELTPWARRVHA